MSGRIRLESFSEAKALFCDLRMIFLPSSDSAVGTNRGPQKGLPFVCVSPAFKSKSNGSPLTYLEKLTQDVFSFNQ